MFDALKFLEEAGIDKFRVNYKDKIISDLSKDDLFKLMKFTDDGSCLPVAFARDGWLFTTERLE